MKTKITLVLALFFSLYSFGQLAVGQTFAANGINYIVTKATLPYEVAVGINWNFAGAATIPASVTNAGYSFVVTSIGDNAFFQCTGLTSVTIPNSVNSIGYAAFDNCFGLTSITIPNSVTSIGEYVFLSCYGLTSVSIPNSVTSISYGAFANCTGLTSVSIPNSVTSIGDYAFDRCSSLTSVSIPNSVTSIGDYAFASCNALTSVSIPNSVTSIGEYVFEGCFTLTSVSIPNSLTSIASGAFSGCTGLTSVSIPNSVTSIGNQAFFACSGLPSVTIPNSVTNFGSGVFARCSGLTSFTVNWTTPIVINSNVFTSVNLSTITLNVPAGRVAAYDAAPVWTDFGAITEVVAPFIGQTFAANGINYIVTKATLPYEVAVGSNTTFVGAANIPASLTNAGYSFAVTSISSSAFDNCTGLTSVTIPNSVTSIGQRAFNGCIALTSVSIPNSVTSINRGTFSSCTGLTSVNIPNSVTSIGQTAFSNCSKLTSVVIPDSVTSIDSEAFSSCSGLTSVSIGNSVTFIGFEAFGSCSGLTSINIPASVTIIDIFAFDNCPRLTSVTVNWAIPIEVGREIFGFNFDDNGDLDLSHITLYVPAGTQSAYDAAEVWTSFRSVNDVDNVFNYCKGTIATTLVSPFAAGSTVKWYTVATGGRALASAPTPITTTAGTKLFYVSQVVGGVESARQEITVNTFVLPATPGTITGTASQGVLVGTTTTATYSIAAVLNATSYTWTAPTGVNIVSGQGTNTVTVNFANVPAGAGAIGNLSVIAINSNDCSSLVRNLALTKALPTAPSSIRMTNAALPLPLSGVRPAITTFAPYMGTTTELTLTARPSTTATSYVWELPTGVVVTNGSATTIGGVTESASNVITVNFSGVTNTNTFSYMTTATVPVSINTLRIGVYSKNGTGLSTTNNAALANSSPLFTPNHTSTARLLTLTAIRPVAPAALKLTNVAAVAPALATTAIVDISRFIGTSTELTLTATVSTLASEYVWELPAGTNILYTDGALTTSSNVIKVNFLNVPAGAATYYLGVYAKNGINLSTRDNSLLVPATTTEARVLRVAALVATVPASLRSRNNGGVSTTNISSYVGTSTPLTLTTAVVPNALSYTFTVPAGVDIAEDAAGDTSSSTTSTSFTTTLTTITVDYEGVASGVGFIPVAVKANNFVGSSIVRVLMLNAVAPSTPTVSGTLAICPTAATSVVYTIPTPAVGATSYNITVPEGCTITKKGKKGAITSVDNAAILVVLESTFTVNYPSGFIANATTSKRVITIQSQNGFGVNLVSRTLNLTNARAVCTPRLADSAVANEFSLIAYPNPSSSEFTIETSDKGAMSVKVYDMQGRLIENTNSTQVGSKLAAGTYNIIVKQGNNSKSVRVIKK